MTVSGGLHRVDRYLVPATRGANAWITTLGTAFAIAFAYFCAARLGLAMRATPSGIAVFWPAAGVAAGILICVGRRAGVALVVGVLVGTVAANLTSDRSFLTSVLKGFCNAGEAVLMAWLLDRWFGWPFAFRDLRRVAGFLAAATLATATSATGGAMTMITFHVPAQFWGAWLTWFLAGAVGIVVVAPPLIELGQLRREPPSRAQLMEGAGVLSLASLASLYAVSLPTGSWLSYDTDAVVFPLLLWLVVRNQQTFAIAGAFVVSIATIGATTFGIGYFGDVSASTWERVVGAQLVATMVTAFTLVLTGVFAERRRAEALLKESKARLADALAGGQVVAFDWDAVTGRSQRSESAIEILGSEMASTLRSDFVSHVHPDDRANLKTHIRKLRPGDPSYALSFRYVRPDGRQVWLEEIARGAFDASGKLLRIKGLTRDITERRRAEFALQDSEAKLAGILAIAGDAIVSIDGNHRITLFNETAERLFGYSRGEMIGQPMDLLIPTKFRMAHHQHIERFTSGPDVPRRMAEQREVSGRRKNGEEFPIEASISTVKFNGEWVSTVVLRDITERKRAEERQRALLAELDHRVKNALTTVSSVVSQTRQESRSVATFAEALDARIRSMAATHELLSSGRWQGISLPELVRRELAPYAARDNTEINGPNILLKSDAGQAMAMVLHELATNAAKYGALSNENGRVSIRWDQQRNEQSGSHLVFEWQETGGPPVETTGKPSYGTTTICDLIPYEFGGTVDLVFASDGVRCRLELPAEWLSNDGEPVSEADAHISLPSGAARA